MLEIEDGHSEASIQNALYFFRRRQRQPFIVPNAVMRWGEVDLLTVTTDRLAVEHEIKITRADFKRDEIKFEKHLILSGKVRLKDGERDALKCPNYFFYVVPTDLIKVEEVPKYAGLIYVPDWGDCKVMKNAPRLHSIPIGDATLVNLSSKLAARYWAMRVGK